MKRTLVRLQLKRAIILEDARRIQKNEEPINNIWRLAKELSNKFPEKYDRDKITSRLYDLQKKGTIGNRTSFYIMDVLIDDLCSLLNISKEYVIEEEEL